MDNIRDMIATAFSGDASAFEKGFDGIMADKMNSAISAKYDSMFGSSENNIDQEHVDQENETQETED